MKKFLLASVMLLAVGGGCLQVTGPADNDGDDMPGNGGTNGAICKNTCGNGSCDAIVCQGTGCPCAETAESCPQDCSAGGIDDHADEGGPYSNLIQPVLPVENSLVTSPVMVTGQARGSWYFEASFPVQVYDANGKLLGTGIAQAQTDWMTEEFVSFVANVTFTPSTTATGKIVLRNDNASGLPEHDKSVEIPVKF